MGQTSRRKAVGGGSILFCDSTLSSTLEPGPSRHADGQ